MPVAVQLVLCVNMTIKHCAVKVTTRVKAACIFRKASLLQGLDILAMKQKQQSR